MPMKKNVVDFEKSSPRFCISFPSLVQRGERNIAKEVEKFSLIGHCRSVFLYSYT